MSGLAISEQGFRAAPMIDYQIFVTNHRPEKPSSFLLTEVDGVWLASDHRLRVTKICDSNRQPLAVVVGFVYSEFERRYILADSVTLPVEINNLSEFESRVLPRLSGMYVVLTTGAWTRRLYLDHGGSFPLVFSKREQRAASSPALLLDEYDYQERFQANLHSALVVREGKGSWMPGTMTAHREVSRLLPNHYLDLSDWTAHRFWPRLDDFKTWRNFDRAADDAASALSEFCTATCDAFKVAVTLTAGFDSRLLLASCRDSLSRCKFFTISSRRGGVDLDMARTIAERFGLNHCVLPLREAKDTEIAVWDRTVGNCMIEQPRFSHPTLRNLTDCDAVFTGMYGEVGRCRLYRRDFQCINEKQIGARFIVDRLTLPAHPAIIEDVDIWLSELVGQPNSVVLDLAFHELKFASWAMGQHPLANSIKLNFLPFAQRAVLEAFIGVAPLEKGNGVLFQSIIERLWPTLVAIPINKYGDVRDYLTIWQKITDPNRVRRFFRDRIAKADSGA